MSRPQLTPSDKKFIVIAAHLLPLTKSATNGTYVKYYPSVAFLPSVVSAAFY